MRFWGCCSLAVALSASAVAHSSTIPPANASQFINLPPITPVSNSGFGTLQSNYPGTAFAGAISATATGAGGSSPSLSVSATSSGGGANTGGQVFVQSQITYFFEVTGPGSLPVPVIFSSSGNAMTNDSAFGVDASVTIFQSNGAGGYTFFGDELACAGDTSQSAGPCNDTIGVPPSYDVSKIINIDPNTLYEVAVEGDITRTPAGNDPFSASASVDPTFTLAPGVNSAYSLQQSSNLGSTVTPEPSSFLLLGTGLAGFAGLLRKHLS